MPIRTMTVRLDPNRTACPIPPALVRLRYDTSKPFTVKFIEITLNTNEAPDTVKGGYQGATNTATIQVGANVWAHLSQCLGQQPFMASVNVDGNGKVTAFTCFLYSGLRALLPRPPADSPASDLNRDVFAMRRELSSMRALLGDILIEMTQLNRSQSELYARSERRSQPESERVLRNEYEEEPAFDDEEPLDQAGGDDER
jgi:hypothetical protein